MLRILGMKSFHHFDITARRIRTIRTVIPYSKDNFRIKRGSYATVGDADIKHFENILPNRNQILLGLDETAGYNRDYFNYVRGLGEVVLRPRTTAQVSAILQHCNRRKLAISVYGGNTGVCGGSIPVFDEIVLSMELMNGIESIDEYSGVLQCEAGCILGVLEEKLSEKGLIMPLDLGSKNSCHIGGNVATNAGGIRLMRYGNLQGSVLGLEAVKADGTVLDLMSRFRKDNTGYHLKNIFIGSEGTLGVMTRVAIACPPAPTTQNVLFLGVQNYESVLKTFIDCKKRLGEILTSCELIDKDALQCCIEHLKRSSPIEEYPFYMLIETTGRNVEHDEQKVNDFLKQVLSSGIVADGVVANEPSKVMVTLIVENPQYNKRNTVIRGNIDQRGKIDRNDPLRKKLESTFVDEIFSMHEWRFSFF